jgi:glyoxylase-like metal-dependent hydrolase (beta-lactamase superfamily II)
MIIKTLPAGLFKLDGGAMFGVVPKSMWQKLNPPDDLNMCTWTTRCLLVSTGNRHIVIDTGLGNKYDDKFAGHFYPHGSDTLIGSLAQQGLTPGDITDVVLTHLHFDHCGGALIRHPDGQIGPTFANAVYWCNEPHWQWASTPNPREAASFLAPNFKPLEQTGQLQMVNLRKKEWLPGISFYRARGHTESMMVPIITTPTGQTLIYCADTMPSVNHIGMPYIMAYDIRPLDAMHDKSVLLKTAVERQALLIFEHDHQCESALVGLDSKGRTVATDRISVDSFLGV